MGIQPCTELPLFSLVPVEGVLEPFLVAFLCFGVTQ